MSETPAPPAQAVKEQSQTIDQVLSAQSTIICNLEERLKFVEGKISPETLNASKDPELKTTVCELCGEKFEQYDAKSVCPACTKYYNRKRDWKLIIGIFATLFALIQTPLLQLIYSGVGSFAVSVELRSFLSILFGGIVVVGIAAYQKIAGSDAKEQADEIVELNHKLDLVTQEKNMTKAFNETLVDRLADAKETLK